MRHLPSSTGISSSNCLSADTRCAAEQHTEATDRPRAAKRKLEDAVLSLDPAAPPSHVDSSSICRAIPTVIVSTPPLSREEALERMKQQIKRDVDAFAGCTVDRINASWRAVCDNPRYIDAVSVVEVTPCGRVSCPLRCDKEGSRSAQIINLTADAMQYAQRLGRKIPDTRLFLYCSDTYAFEHQDFPFLVMAKPRNKAGILMPDNTFFAHLSPSGIHESWAEIKQKCADSSIAWSRKQPVLFFRGADTDRGKQDIRATLSNIYYAEDESEELEHGSIFKVILQDHREDLSDFTRYRYLLNLPGKQPWSYRFKYLFLMQSVVINVDVRQKYRGGTEYNDSWINAFDVLFDPNVDFINLPFYWIEGRDEHNEEERRNLVLSLREIYHFFEKFPDLCDKIIQNGSRKIDIITDDFIYDYIYHLVMYYSEILGPTLAHVCM